MNYRICPTTSRVSRDNKQLNKKTYLDSYTTNSTVILTFLQRFQVDSFSLDVNVRRHISALFRNKAVG